MKYTVSLLLLVAIGHAAEPSKRRGEDDNSSAKRELLEGNYGLRIRPAGFGTALPSARPAFESPRQNDQLKQTPTQEFSPLGAPVSKISDVLTGQGPSFSAAIASHLYSPVSIYQQRFGPPTTFEISPPVPSQLAYSEHNIFNPFQQNFENQKLPSVRLPQPQQFQSNQQQNNEYHANLKNRLFNNDQKLIINEQKRYGPQELLPNQNLVQNAETVRQANAEQSRRAQQEHLSQINQLNIEAAQKFEAQKQQQNHQLQQQKQQQQLEHSLQVSLLPSVPELQSPRRPIQITEQFLPRLETFQPQARPLYSQQIFGQVFPQTKQIQGFPQDFFQQINQLGNQLSTNDETLQYLQSSDEAKLEGEKQETKPKVDQKAQQVLERQSSTASPQSLTNQNQNAGQALSYARFSQSLIPPNQIPIQPQQFLQFFPTPLPSPSPFPQFQNLLLPQSPQLLQASPRPPVQVIEPIAPQPLLQSLPLRPVLQHQQPTVQPFTSTAPLQTFSTPSNPLPHLSITNIRHSSSSQPQTQPSLTTGQPASSQIFTTLNSQPTFASSNFNGLTKEVASSLVSTTVTPRSSSSSPENRFTTPLSVTIVPKFVSTLTSRSNTLPPPPLPTSTPLVRVTTSSPPSLPPSTFATQPSTETPFSTILTSTEAPLTPILQTQPTLVALQTPKPQPITVQSTEHLVRPTLPPLQVLTSSQPLPAQHPVPQLPQQEIPGIRAVPVQRFQIQSRLQPLFQVQNYEQQPLQLVPLQPVPLEITATPSPQLLPQILQLIPIQPRFDYQTQPHYQSEPKQQLQQQQQLPQQQSQQQKLQQQQSLEQQSQQQQYQQQHSQKQQFQLQQSLKQELQHQHLSPQLSEQPLQEQQLEQQQLEQQQLEQPQSQKQQLQQQQSQQQQLQQQQSQQQQLQPQQSQQQLSQPQQSQQQSQQEPQQTEKEAITHAQEVFNNIYSPFFQKPLYSESEEFVIQHPHFGASSLPFSSPYSSTPLYPVHPSPAFPAYPAIQYFGTYAKNIFAEPNYHHLKKK